jgi:hypothetical protein
MYMHREPRTPRHTLPAAVACLLSIPAFGATSDLTLNVSAKIVTGPQGASVLWLTPAQEGQAGSAFTTNSVAFSPKYIFSTFFQFQMTDPGPGGASDGMTFTLQTESATALGANGGDLGYLGITPSVAVELNTWQNAPFDINDNDVAVLTNADITGLGPQTAYGVTNCQPTGAFSCMSNGDTWSVWIDYDGTNLRVAIADNSTTRPVDLLSYPIDIASVLGQTSAFVGFTAGTGLGYENHAIANWQFH